MARCTCSIEDEIGVKEFHVEKDHAPLIVNQNGKMVEYLGSGPCKRKGCTCQKFVVALDKPRGAFLNQHRE